MQRIADTIRPDGGASASGQHKIGTTEEVMVDPRRRGPGSEIDVSIRNSDPSPGGHTMIRRTFIGALAVVLAVGLLVVLPGGGSAQQKVAKIGMSLPITGADKDSADAIQKGAQMAIDEINAKGGVAGYKLESVVFD